MRKVIAPFAAFVAGCLVGSALRTSSRPSLVVSPEVVVTRHSYGSGLTTHRLVVYRAARADGTGELTPTRDKPPGEEWVINAGGVLYRAVSADANP